MSAAQREIYRLDDLILDVDAVTLFRGETQIPLNGLSFDLLSILVREAPKVVSRESLMDQIWQDACVGEETLKQRVRLLRKSLGDDSKQPRYIETVRGRGYKLACPVTREIQQTGKPVLHSPAQRSRSGLWIAAIILVAGLVWSWQNQSVGDQSALEPRPVNGNLAVEELYQRASVYYKRYMPNDNANAIGLLEEAIRQDPKFAKAYALLSKAYSQQPKLGNGRFDQEALAAAKQALALEPDLPEAYDALGLHHDVNSRPQKALKAYEAALAKDPDHPAALSNAAYSLMILGDLERALVLNARGLQVHPQTQYGNVQMGDNLRLLELDSKAETWLKKAVTLQPDNVLANMSYAKFLLLQSRYAEALEVVEKSESSPWGQGSIHMMKGDIYLFQGDFAKAESHYVKSEAGCQADGSYRLCMLKVLREEEAPEQALKKVEAEILKAIEYGNRYASLNLELAGIKAWTGEGDEALAWLDKALDLGWTDLRWLSADPSYKALRELPGFETRRAALRQRLSAMQSRVIDQNLIP